MLRIAAARCWTVERSAWWLAPRTQFGQKLPIANDGFYEDSTVKLPITAESGFGIAGSGWQD